MQIKKTITAGVAEKMNANDTFNEFVLDSVYRHLSGDWGDVSVNEAEINAADPLNAMSAYHAPNGTKIWIKQNGKFLTVLFPDEY